MPMQEFHDNWKLFFELVEKLPQTADENMNIMIKRYIEQILMLLNEVFTTSIESLQHLKDAKNTNDVICMHAKYTNDVSKKLALSAQRFMNASLGHIADYNEWLKSHCDLATD